MLEATVIVLSGTTCTEGEAHALVFATGMSTELGQDRRPVAARRSDESPLEIQVRRVAWLIAAIAVTMGHRVHPDRDLRRRPVALGRRCLRGRPARRERPEGLLPVITLALAVGVRDLVRRGAVVKRLTAVETLGSTDVICTDKTGTLTENRMRVTTLWSAAGTLEPTPTAGPPAIPGKR